MTMVGNIVIFVVIVGVLLVVCGLILRSVRAGSVQINVVPRHPPEEPAATDDEHR
ncbi:hypothetical protein V7968_10880 [Nocardia vulneris]|uniref:hypothetical protein n=1 Tax=Nocardia vulneris TaxID=1141657 RepID=UPI0030D5D93E